jgi:hypothetical protein
MPMPTFVCGNDMPIDVECRCSSVLGIRFRVGIHANRARKHVLGLGDELLTTQATINLAHDNGKKSGELTSAELHTTAPRSDSHGQRPTRPGQEQRRIPQRTDASQEEVRMDPACHALANFISARRRSFRQEWARFLG